MSIEHGGGKGGVRKIPAIMARLAQKIIDVMGLDVRANDPSVAARHDSFHAFGSLSLSTKVASRTTFARSEARLKTSA